MTRIITSIVFHCSIYIYIYDICNDAVHTEHITTLFFIVSGDLFCMIRNSQRITYISNRSQTPSINESTSFLSIWLKQIGTIFIVFTLNAKNGYMACCARYMYICIAGVDMTYQSNVSYGRKVKIETLYIVSQIARFMGPTLGPPGSCRPHMDPMLAPWTLLSGVGMILRIWQQI